MILAAFSEAVPLVTAQQLLTAVPDQIVRSVGDQIIVPPNNNLIGYFAIGLDIQAVQLQTPSLRRFALLDIAPVEITALPAFPPNWIVRADNPLVLVKDEVLNGLAGNANAGPQQESILVLLADRPPARIAGNPVTIAGAVVVPASVGYIWQAVPVVLAQELPVGSYDIIGARLEYANGIAFRIAGIGSVNRPGGICVADQEQPDPEYQRLGGLGVWETFTQLNIPNIEVFDDGTGGAAVLYLDLIQR
jgi:hypothetical protein